MADGLERIPVNVEDVAEDAGAFLEKIEIVPLGDQRFHPV